MGYIGGGLSNINGFDDKIKDADDVASNCSAFCVRVEKQVDGSSESICELPLLD